MFWELKVSMNILNTIVWSGTTLAVEPTHIPVMHELQATVESNPNSLHPCLVPALIGDLARSPLLDQSLIGVV